MESMSSSDKLQLTSPVFKNAGTIPAQYTCRADNVSPPLNIVNPPAETKSFALIMHDPDAPVGDFVHWVVWDIQPATHTIPANGLPVGARQGVNDFKNNAYGGPCPPPQTGTHRYIFELYALDTSLALGSDTTRNVLEDSMQGHILQKAELIGTFSADN